MFMARFHDGVSAARAARQAHASALASAYLAPGLRQNSEGAFHMRTRFSFFIGLAASCAGWALSATPAPGADCSQGSAGEQIACLNHTVGELASKVEALNKDALKWNDRIALINEDMRIYPRCLENPGPNTANITDVVANSCAKIPAQTWMIAKPYH